MSKRLSPRIHFPLKAENDLNQVEPSGLVWNRAKPPSSGMVSIGPDYGLISMAEPCQFRPCTVQYGSNREVWFNSKNPGLLLSTS